MTEVFWPALWEDEVQVLKATRTAAPSGPVVSLAEAALHARAEGAVEDNELLAALVQSATDHLDGLNGILGRCLINQQWLASFADWPCRLIRLPFPSTSAVVVKYSDADGDEQTLNASEYELLEDTRGSLIRFRTAFTRPTVSSDRSDAVRITMTAGFGTAADVPQAIKLAIMMLAAHWYQTREAATIGVQPHLVPAGVSALLAPYRRMFC